MKVHAIRILPGADLRKSVDEFVASNELSAAYIATAVGSLECAAIRLAGARDTYEDVGDYELVSLQGTLGLSGSHLHISIADQKGQVIGGHLLEGCTVRTTCEVVVVSDFGLTFEREFDDMTGFHELRVVQAAKEG